MATFIPPMLPGVVVFMRGYNPGEIVAQIKTRRVSVLVSVPKILDVLREHVAARRSRSRDRCDAAGRSTAASFGTSRRWWRYRARPPAVRLEVLGVRRRRGAARGRARGVLGRARLRRDPGLRPDRDRADRHAEPSVRHQARIGRQGHRRRRGEDRAGRRDPRARRERDDAATSTRPRRPRARSRTAGSTPATSARSATDGQLFIRGRKKEMIVTPEGLNVFPEDVERVLTGCPACATRRWSARGSAARSACTRCSCSTPGADPDAIVRAGERASSPITRRSAARWSGPSRELPRTEGTRKLKRAAIRDWVTSGGTPRPVDGRRPIALAALLAKYAGPRRSRRRHDARGAGPELARARRADGRARGRVSDADRRRRVRRGARSSASCARSSSRRRPATRRRPSRSSFRRGTDRGRRAPSAASACRPGSCRSRACSRGCASRASSTSERSTGPVIFAANHQSHMDTPVILAALPARLALPRRAGDGQGVLQGALLSRASTAARAWFTNSLNYYLAALFFNAFPLPQREAGRAADAALHRRAARGRLLGADLSGGHADRRPARSTGSARASG